jgi:hypothetical protein
MNHRKQIRQLQEAVQHLAEWPAEIVGLGNRLAKIEQALAERANGQPTAAVRAFGLGRQVEQRRVDQEVAALGERIGAGIDRAARLAEAVDRILATFELTELLQAELQAAVDTYRSEAGA